MFSSFRLEACLLNSSDDYLENGLWLNLSNQGIYVFYDSYWPKIIDLMNVNVGISLPLVGNVVYDNKILWKLPEQERADLLCNEISVLSAKQFHELWNQTTLKIIQEEIAFHQKSFLKHRWLANAYLKERQLFDYKKIKFADLDEKTKNAVIIAKLFYKKPKYVHIDFINQKDELISFCNAINQSSEAGQAMIFIYTNENINQPNLTQLDLQNDCQNSNEMIYSVHHENKAKWWHQSFKSQKLFFSMSKLARQSLSFFWTWFLSSFILINLVGFTSVFDFEYRFNLDVQYDLNGLIASLSLIGYCIYFGLLVIWFSMLYRRYDQQIKELIARGINRMILFNSYLFAISIVLFWSSLISIILNLLIIPLVFNHVVMQINIIWPIIFYILIFSTGLIFHYRYIFKTYKINLPNLTLF